MALLDVRDLSVYYGTIQALNGISFHVEPGEIVAMIGPNGAGKSTALRAVCGLIPLTGQSGGQVFFDDTNITGLQPHELVKRGMSLVPQGRRLFGSLNVMENLEMGGFTLRGRKNIGERLAAVFDLFPKLAQRRRQLAITLSSGEQQILAIGRALMLQARLLLIDEPSIGLSPNSAKMVFQKLEEIRSAGTSILIVEQRAMEALRYSDRTYVFERGEIAIAAKNYDTSDLRRVRAYLLGNDEENMIS